jgi:hypothetical protein
MKDQYKITALQKEMTFTMELWKHILEIEEFVRNHYLKLAETELYDLDDDETDNKKNYPF